LKVGNPNWSLAILVKSKDMMLRVSSYLGSTSARLPEVAHDVLIDPEGPALSAVLIGGLLQGAADVVGLERTLLDDVIAHMRGRNGGNISQKDLTLAEALSAHRSGTPLRGSTRLALMADVREIASGRMSLALTGDPEVDWLAVRDLVDAAAHEKLNAIADDARFIRLLNRGTLLREKLAERWRATGSYEGAREIVSDALLQEHFSAATRVWSGVNVMTIHKSKGKEFDEVIIFEGAYAGRLLRQNGTARDIEQARLALRVAVLPTPPFIFATAMIFPGISPALCAFDALKHQVCSFEIRPPDLLGRATQSRPEAAPQRAKGAGLDGNGTSRATLGYGSQGSHSLIVHALRRHVSGTYAVPKVAGVIA
jgi:DNA helicase-2/ATP-dependent DNA helicase PcrA